MIVILYICHMIWGFPVPWWMYVIAVFDGVMRWPIERAKE
jgi:hypothetical protein